MQSFHPKEAIPLDINPDEDRHLCEYVEISVGDIPLNEIRADFIAAINKPGRTRDQACDDAEPEYYSTLAAIEAKRKNPQVANLLAITAPNIRPGTLKGRFTQVEHGRLMQDSANAIANLADIMTYIHFPRGTVLDLNMNVTFIESDLEGAVLSTPDNIIQAHYERFRTDEKTRQLMNFILWNSSIHEPTDNNLPEA